MHIHHQNRQRKRAKKWLIAALALLLATGITKPVQAAVSQDDLNPPTMDTDTHTYLIWSNPTEEERDTYHQATYSYVYFGMYPQREVTGTELTDKIRKATYDGNGDATVDGKKYRRINYNQTGIKYMPGKWDEDSWTAGSTDGYRYFLYEPIRWRILSNDKKTLLLQSENGLDCQPFGCEASQIYTGFWSTCDLRKWLNYKEEQWHDNGYHTQHYRNSLGFYQYAFSKEEKAKIQVTHLTQDSYPDFDRHGGEDTEDKIFILSYTELRKAGYGFCERASCFARGCKNTDYGYAVQGYSEHIRNNYWVRTPGSSFRDATNCGGSTGGLLTNSEYASYTDAIRPCANVTYSLSDCFKVSFHTGVSSQTIESQVMLGSSVAKEPEAPVKEGFTFLGWYTDKNCTKPYDFTEKLTKDTTLYAGWKDPNSTTTGNGGTDVVTSDEMEAAEDLKYFDITKKSYTIRYKVLSNDQRTVSCKIQKNKSKAKDVTIPATVQYKGITYNVIAVSDNAFQGCTNLQKITIGTNVKSIGKRAFKTCKKLTTVTIKTGSNLTTIGSQAFQGCKNLKKITIRKKVTIIGSQAFEGCTKLKTVTFITGSNLTTIGTRAFRNCKELTKITIPSKVTKIGKGAFRDCKKLKTITVNTQKLTNKTIGKNAFKGIYQKATFKLPKEKYKDYKKVFQQKKIGYQNSMKIKKK